jgi:hypothetical protein
MDVRVTTKTVRRAWAVALLAAPAALGCGNPSQNDILRVGDNGEGGQFAGDDSSAAGEFDAHIEEDHVMVKIVVVHCAGECADVQAVATGGHPPYSFAWNDGSTNPARQVCPTSDTAYDVKVSDTATAGEFPRPPETVDVPLTANVLGCADGGASGDGGTVAPETGFHWVHWSSQTVGNPGSATGTLLPSSGAITVMYSGEVYQPILSTQVTNYFVPATTYTCSTVGNPPTEADGIILQSGGTATVDTLTFSRPVTDPVFAIMSLGNSQDGTECFYEFGAFGESFTILQQGMGEMAGPGTLVDVDGGLTGNDGDGLVQLNGTFSTIKWTDPIVGCEGFGDHGFTVGIGGP